MGDDRERNTMFCFSVYTSNTGSSKKSYEKELLIQQREKGVSIFACDAQDVYSDVEVSLGGGVSTIKVEDTDKDFHFAKRKTTGAWINTGMFMQVWKAIGKKGAYSSYDWTVKVDPDAVSFQIEGTDSSFADSSWWWFSPKLRKRGLRFFREPRSLHEDCFQQFSCEYRHMQDRIGVQLERRS